MTLNPKHCTVAAVIAGLLALPAVAAADGTFDFQSDQSHVLAHAKTTDGMGAFYFVLTFPQQVTEASTSQGAPCQLNFNNDPKVIECQVPPAAPGTPQPSAQDIMATVAAALACTDTIGLRSSVDGRSYRDDGKLVNSKSCDTQPPPPNPNPPPTAPTPDDQPAGNAVAKPRNGIVVAQGSTGPNVRLFEPPGMTAFSSFMAYSPSFAGGVRVAAGDVNGDGLMDVVTAPGPGGAPNVKVFDGKTGMLLQSFFAYDAAYSGGVFVAAGDVNGDGKADIITGTDSGAGPHVRVFDGGSGMELRSFFAFDPGFTGGVRVAAGDVNGDGKADIITGAGPGGGPQVKVFDGGDGKAVQSFFAFDPAFHGGLFVGSGDLDGDGSVDVIVGPDAGAGPHVKAFSGKTGGVLASFFAQPTSFLGGIRVATGDVNGDGTPDMITGPGSGGAPEVRVFDGSTDTLLKSFNAFDPGFSGGVFVGDGIEPPGAAPGGGGTLPLIRGGITVKPRCPTAIPGGSCKGQITVFVPAVQKSGVGKAAAKKAKKPLVLGKAKFKIAAGKGAKVHIALSKKSLKALGNRKKIKVVTRVVTRDAAGNASARQKTVTLARR